MELSPRIKRVVCIRGKVHLAGNTARCNEISFPCSPERAGLLPRRKLSCFRAAAVRGPLGLAAGSGSYLRRYLALPLVSEGNKNPLPELPGGDF